MGLIITPNEWRQQPPYYPGINSKTPITAGLSAVFDGVSKRFGNTQATGDTSIRRVGSSGVGITTDYIGSNFLEFPHRPQFVVTGGISLGIVFDVDTIGQYGGLIAKQATGTTHCPYELRIGSGINDSNFEFLRANGSGYKSFAGTGNRLSSGQKYIRLMITAPSGISNQPTGYLNGSSFTMATASGAGSGDATDNGASSVRLGTRADGVTFLYGGIYFVGIWNRQLSAPEALGWTQNPWQVYRKSPITYFIPSAGGGGATIAGDSGSYTLSGADVSLKAGRKLAADSGSYALSGSDVAFKRGYALTADSGTYALDGTAVSLTAGRKLTAESGSYTLTGTDVTLLYSPAGSYSLTADSGAYTLAGTDATLKVSRTLTADSGTYTLTGADATLSKGVKLTADSGSYSLTGSDVAFARTYVLTAESGTYSLTGTSAGLTWSGAPAVEVPTNGGASIYGKPVFREKQFRKEYEAQVKRIEDEKRLARILREDEEITVIMALMAA